MTITAGTPATVHDRARVVLLDDLARELAHCGIAAWVLEPEGRIPVLTASCPETGREADVYSAPVHSDPGRPVWWFWWSHAERIGPCTGTFEAARVITGQLAQDRGDD